MTTSTTSNCDPAAVLFGMLGAAAALSFANIGAGYGTAKAGVSVAHLGIQNPSRVMRGIVPVVMAGILGIYGLIVAVIISNNIKVTSGTYSLFQGFMHLGAGTAAGMASLAAGYAIGIIGDICCYAYAKTDKIFVPMILMLIFAEALGLYGLIIALLMNNRAVKCLSGVLKEKETQDSQYESMSDARGEKFKTTRTPTRNKQNKTAQKQEQTSIRKKPWPSQSLPITPTTPLSTFFPHPSHNSLPPETTNS
eukprot:CAMPEP_0176434884 /NCGR_PEP_ID=MMETSP0127-20121128/16958_1 /TAXON_ID=938130 /ORGANISM="Platyophrya macrostoma, Strain WH" /LENGTH=250 /DNA_ID=CAMNT_0017817737 /DNA_START=51 /DNA_END=799 /DNA_ORIENTATION=-